MMWLIVLLSALWIWSYYQCSIGLIASSEFKSGQESSQTTWITNNLIYKNIITLRNADWHDNAWVFDYHQPQESNFIQYYNYDKIIHLKGFDNHCIHSHGKGTQRKYGAWADILSTYTNILVAFGISTTASSNNNTNNNNTNNKIISNSNMSDLIIENDNVIGLHVKDLSDNERNKIISGKKDTDSERSNQTVMLGDNDVEIDKMYGNSQTCLNIYGIDGFYERYKSFGLTYTCIHNDIYSYTDAKSRESKLSWKYWTKQDWRVC